MQNHIKEKRQEQGLSQTAFARALGVDPTTVWRWERGETLPHWATLARIAKLLKTHMSDLIADVSTLPPSEDSDTPTFEEIPHA